MSSASVLKWDVQLLKTEKRTHVHFLTNTYLINAAKTIQSKPHSRGPPFALLIYAYVSKC